jgi:hypothetical protein
MSRTIATYSRVRWNGPNGWPCHPSTTWVCTPSPSRKLAAGKAVERHGGHRRRGRRAPGHLHDPGADVDARGRRRDPRDGVTASEP